MVCIVVVIVVFGDGAVVVIDCFEMFLVVVVYIIVVTVMFVIAVDCADVGGGGVIGDALYGVYVGVIVDDDAAVDNVVEVVYTVTDVDLVVDVALVVIIVAVDVVFVGDGVIFDALTRVVDVRFFVVTVVDHIAVAVVGEEDSVGALIVTVVGVGVG